MCVCECFVRQHLFVHTFFSGVLETACSGRKACSLLIHMCNKAVHLKMLIDCIQFDAQKNSIHFLSAVCPSVFSFLFVKFYFLFLAQIAKTLSRSSYPMVRGCESHHYQWEDAERRSMSPSLVCRACSPLWRLRGTIAFNCFTSALDCIRHLKDRELGCHLISEMQGFLLYTQTHSTGWNTQLRLWTGWGSSVGDWEYSYSKWRWITCL